MFRYIVLACLLVSVGHAANKIKMPYWEDCGGHDTTLKVHDMVLDNPIEISKSKPLHIAMNATQKDPISGDARVSIKINKVLRVLGQNLQVPVPCIQGIGTCEMSLCEIFKIHRKLVCAVFEAAGMECACPSAPGEYVAKDVQYQVNFGLLPTALLAIGNGDYTFEMHVKDNDKDVACLKLGVAVKFVQ